MERGKKERESQEWRTRGENYSSPKKREIMEELVSGGWINSLLADKEGFTLALSSFLPALLSLEEIPVLCTPVREIMHANIVKIRFRVRSRPRDSAKERRKDGERAGGEKEGRQGRGRGQNGALRRCTGQGKEKREHRIQPSLLSSLRLPPPFSAACLFSPLQGALAPPRNPLGPTVFFFFLFFALLHPKIFVSGILRRSPFLPGPKCCALPPRRVVDFQLKPEIRSNIRSRWTVRRMGTFGEIRLVSTIFFSRVYEGWSR